MTNPAATTTPTVSLVTGARRGIGRGFIAHLSALPNSIVIAGVRKASDPDAQSLLSLPKHPTSRIALAIINSTSDTDAYDAIARAKSETGITHIDLVVSNTGIAKYVGKVLDTPSVEMSDHFDVNTVGHLRLFKATWPLLEKAKDPKFIIMSSSVGSIGAMQNEPVAMVTYGCSKAATNFLMRKMHYEHERLCVMAIHPGWVSTDMGWYAAETAYGLPKDQKEAIVNGDGLKPLTIDESVGTMLKTIGAADRSKSGKFTWHDGKEIPF